MQYVFSMTPRMVASAIACAVAFCVLIFLFGLHLGHRWQSPAVGPAPADNDAAYFSLTNPPASGPADAQSGLQAGPRPGAGAGVAPRPATRDAH